jgi:hypothetical protein
VGKAQKVPVFIRQKKKGRDKKISKEGYKTVRIPQRKGFFSEVAVKKAREIQAKGG